MLIKYLSSTNDSLHHPDLIFADFLASQLFCFFNTQIYFIFLGFLITNISFLLPLIILILHHGLQRRRQRSATSSAATMSHSDCFTYHLVVMELIAVFGSVMCVCAIIRKYLYLLIVGTLFWCFSWYGETFVHMITCVERYLAVVHPITYMSLRKERGIRIRNISISCAWLFCFLAMTFVADQELFIVMNSLTLILAVTVVSLCSLSVLRVLVRPGPGEQVGGKERVDQSKQKALHTIVAILAALMLRFAASLAWTIGYASVLNNECLITSCVVWFNLPSSLALPLMFLHRAGKLMFWKNIQCGLSLQN